MIINIGIDILKKNKNISKNINKKILNIGEENQKYILKFFTIKESIVKILGTGFINKFSVKNIKIIYNKLGKPIIKKKNKNIKILISTSDEKNIIITLSFLIKLNKFY